tara:strand:- start:1185 stop:2096 length:912 start_codon:yes stop_codon:yes gene_type:complete
LKNKFTLSIYKLLFLFVVFLFCLSSCKKDDQNTTNEIPANDYGEQHIIENDSIIDFMQNHFYNYEDFSNLSPGDAPELIIDSIKGNNSNKTSIYDQVSSFQINVKDSNGDLFPHTAYYVILRDGIGESPTVADSVYVRYKGMLLNKDVFDKRNTPIWLQAKNVVRGFQEFVPFLKKGNIDINANGTYNFTNFGLGFIIMPSGLGYYNTATVSIPSYSPLIFQVEMITLNRTDHDNDTVLTILEDLDGDSNFDNDDTDSDTIPNYQDPDDDNDGVLTKDEYDVDGDGMADDTDGDGIPDYLDNE